MQEITTLIDWIQGIGFVGLLILLAIPKTRNFLGFGTDLDAQNIVKEITDEIRRDFEYDKPDRPALIARIPVICSDMKSIREKQGEMAEDLSYIKGRLDKIGLKKV